MPHLSLPLAGLLTAAILCLSLLTLLVLRYRRRHTAAQKEARRRQAVTRRGRLCDGTINDLDGVLLLYSYSLAGVEYTAAQDVAWLPLETRESLLRGPGRVSIKYLPNNPANSIVLSEEWSGLRRQSPTPYAKERQGAILG